jgi:hypothetical protein
MDTTVSPKEKEDTSISYNHTKLTATSQPLVSMYTHSDSNLKSINHLELAICLVSITQLSTSLSLEKLLPTTEHAR